MRRTLAILLVCTIASAQTPIPDTNPPAQDSTGFVVRINVNLVQMDAVVTDAKGRPVTDLKADDFEIFQDGVPQKITNFSYITAGVKPAAQPVAAPQAKNEPLVPIPPVTLKPEQVHRVIALVVDDLGLSTTGIAYVRSALKKFVDHDMQPGDLVAIIRTGAGIGALQQFTTDKRMLYASIDRVKFNFMGRAGSFVPINPAPAFDANATLTLPQVGAGELSQRSGPDSSTASNGGQNPSVAAMVSEPDDACSLVTGSTVGSLAAARYVVQGLRDLPGRKALILFSESMQMLDRPGVIPTRPFQSGPRTGGFEPSNSWTCDYSRVKQSLRKLTDAAERAAVVFYTVDPRGVDPLMFDIADNPLSNAHNMQAAGGAALPSGLAGKREDRRISQEGMQYLAEETGGTFVYHNDIAGAIREAVDDSGSYYLIAYHPPASTFDEKNSRWKFHSVKVQVKRAELKVRSRTGFFGFPGQERDEQLQSREQQFARVLVSPFTANQIHLRMTTLFSYFEKPIITTLLYVDGSDLNFTTNADGTHGAVLDAVAITFDENGMAVDDTQHTYTIRATESGYAKALKNGVILTLQHGVQQPGPYQMRVAVRDAASQKMGSASQFVEVPDLKRHRLALSGILLKQELPAPSATTGPDASQAAALDPKGNEAIRIFQPGEKISWAFQILNAKKGSDQQPNVTVQTRFFRDGIEVFRSEPMPVRWPDNVPANHLAASGQVKLGPKFPPGDYALQVVVTDTLARRKYAMASQWIDFEVEAR